MQKIKQVLNLAKNINNKNMKKKNRNPKKFQILKAKGLENCDH